MMGLGSLVRVFFFQAEDGIRDVERSRGLGDVYKRQPIKPENCRVRRRRESQLITAASLESSTLRWISRENALASWTYRHQEPRTAPVEVV